jgi:hypothetical protein
MCMRRRVAPAARARPVVPVGHTAGGAASYCAVQLRRGPRTARSPGWASGRLRLAEHAARGQSCGVADGVVHQVGPYSTAHVSSELVKAHTPRRRRPSFRNTSCGDHPATQQASPGILTRSQGSRWRSAAMRGHPSPNDSKRGAQCCFPDDITCVTYSCVCASTTMWM